MAATGKVIRVCKHISANTRRLNNFLGSIRYKSSVATQDESNEVKYPPVRPRFPPGTWDKWYVSKGSEACWKEYEKGLELLRIPKVKQRLETISGPYDKPYVQYTLNPYDSICGNGKFKQFVSKTHIISDSLPSQMTDIDCDAQFASLRDSLINEVAKEYGASYRAGMDRRQQTSCLIEQIIDRIFGKLALDNEYLLESQLDKDVRVETFWTRTGFYEENVNPAGKFQDGKYRMQYKAKAMYQIRTEQPLPQFLPIDNELCDDRSYPLIKYGPTAAGQKRETDRCITVSGHWIGDPCEFSLLSIHQVPIDLAKEMRKLGDDIAKQELETYGMFASFASCMAQAYNQGFTMHHEITYPFTAQTMVIDETGRNAQFFGYQLNTMQLDKDDVANPKQNICWVGKQMSLFDLVENGEVKGFNDEAFKQMLRMFMVKPVDRGVDLRPYLPEEMSPSGTPLYINHVGDEPLEKSKIGRFEYPRNAVYF